MVCRVKRWDTGWSARGCYLHLESSELIEALRGKGDSSREEEAADVLLVLLSIIGAHELNRVQMMTLLEAKMEKLILDAKSKESPCTPNEGKTSPPSP